MTTAQNWRRFDTKSAQNSTLSQPTVGQKLVRGWLKVESKSTQVRQKSRKVASETARGWLKVSPQQTLRPQEGDPMSTSSKLAKGRNKVGATSIVTMGDVPFCQRQPRVGPTSGAAAQKRRLSPCCGLPQSNCSPLWSGLLKPRRGPVELS